MSKLIAALCASAFALGSIPARADDGDKNPAAATPKGKATAKRIEDASSKGAPADLKTKPPVGDFWTPRERAMVRPTDPRYLPKQKEKVTPAPVPELKAAP